MSSIASASSEGSSKDLKSPTIGIKAVGSHGLTSTSKKKRARMLSPANPEVLMELWAARKGRAVGAEAVAAFHTCYTALCRANVPHLEAWNMRYQDILETHPTSLAAYSQKQDRLRSLADDFTRHVTPVANTIAKELFLAEEDRTTPSAGLCVPVYRKNGVVYHVWDSMVEAKGVMKCLQQVASSKVVGLHAPLCVVVMCRGHPFTVTACVRLSDTPQLSDEDVQPQLRRLCAHCKVPRNALNHAEVVLSQDGRAYLTDVQGLCHMLPLPGSDLSKLRRPEHTVLPSSNPLSPENNLLHAALASWMQSPMRGDTPPMNETLRSHNSLTLSAISGFSGGSTVPNPQYRVADLVKDLHSKGINLCMLGEARVIAKGDGNEEAAGVLAVEVVARCVKAMMRVEMRSLKSSDIDLFLMCASRLVGAVLENTNDYWGLVINPIAREKFPTHSDAPLSPHDCDRHLLFRRICQVSSCVFTRGSFVDLAPRSCAMRVQSSPLDIALIEGDVPLTVALCRKETGFDTILANAVLLALLGEGASAESQVKRAKGLATDDLSPNNSELTAVLLTQARIAALRNDVPSAIQYYSECASPLRGSIPPLLLFAALFEHAELLLLGKAPNTATITTLMQDANNATRNLHPEVSLQRLVAPKRLLARMHEAAGSLNEALAEMCTVGDIYETIHQGAHPDTATCMAEQASLHERMGATSLAEECHREAVKLMATAVGEHHADTASLLLAFARFLQRTAQTPAAGQRALDIAEELCLRAVTILKHISPMSEPLSAALYHLSQLSRGRSLRLAETHAVEAVEIARQILDPRSDALTTLMRHLVSLRMERRAAVAPVIQRAVRRFLKARKSTPLPPDTTTEEAVASEEVLRAGVEKLERSSWLGLLRSVEERLEGVLQRGVEALDDIYEDGANALQNEEAEERKAIYSAVMDVRLQWVQENETQEETKELEMPQKETEADVREVAEAPKGAEEEAAATKIQALHRGRAGRKDATKRREEGVRELQAQKAAAEAASLEEEEEERQRAAVKIQAVQRGKVARQKGAAVKAQKEEEVKRKKQEQEEEERNAAAATKIQSMQRGRVARKEVAQKRAAKCEGGNREEAAATKIQSVQRGRAARKQVDILKAEKGKTAEDMPPVEEESKEVEQQADPSPEPEPADTAPDATNKEETAAATKIQSMQRGRAARKEVDERRQAKALTAQTEKAQPDQEQHAATKIQSIQRGRAARKEVDNLRSQRQAKPDVTAETPPPPLPADDSPGAERETAAATKIQSMQRGRAARKEVTQKREAKRDKEASVGAETNRETAAATKIQSVQRGRAARKQVDTLKAEKGKTSEDVPPVEEESKEVEQQADSSPEPEPADTAPDAANKEETAAATKIQSMQRGRAARKEVDNLRSQRQAKPDVTADTPPPPLPADDSPGAAEREAAAATKIQSMQRGRAARKEVDERRQAKARTTQTEKAQPDQEQHAATKIQSIQRGRAARKEVDNLRSQRQAKPDVTAETPPPPLPADDSPSPSDNADRETAAATKIQSMQRGRAARKEVTLKREAKRDKEAGIGADTKRETAAATKIQSVQRGRAARKQVDTLKAEKGKTAEDVPPVEEESKEVEQQADPSPEPEPADTAPDATNKEETAAATKIQSMQRGRAARKEVAQKREAKRDKEAGVGADTKRETAAATKIQSVQRGRAARKEVDERRQAKARTAETEKAQPDQEQHAATKIQSIQRGRAARKEVDNLRSQRQAKPDVTADTPPPPLPADDSPGAAEREAAAATKIQSMQRGRAARKEVMQKREAKHKEAGIGSDTKRETAAATKIQSVQRGRAARKETDKRRNEQKTRLEATQKDLCAEEEHAAATKIQSMQRGRQARAEAGRMRQAKTTTATSSTVRAALRIQRTARGYTGRGQLQAAHHKARERTARKREQRQKKIAEWKEQEAARRKAELKAQREEARLEREREKEREREQLERRASMHSSSSRSSRSSSGFFSISSKVSSFFNNLFGSSDTDSRTSVHSSSRHSSFVRKASVAPVVSPNTAATRIQAAQRGKVARREAAQRAQKREEENNEKRIKEEAAKRALEHYTEKPRELETISTSDGGAVPTPASATVADIDHTQREKAATKIQSAQRGRAARREVTARRENGAKGGAKGAEETAPKTESLAEKVEQKAHTEPTPTDPNAPQPDATTPAEDEAKAEPQHGPEPPMEEVVKEEAGGAPESGATPQTDPEAPQTEEPAKEDLATPDAKAAPTETEASDLKEDSQPEVPTLADSRDPEAHKAATKIQTMHRGQAARKEVAGLRRERQAERHCVAVQTFARTVLSTRHVAGVRLGVEREAASLKIQSLTRGRQARQAAAARKAEAKQQHDAACRIQTIQRGRCARKEASGRRAHRKKESDAATRIQSLQRGKQGRAEAEGVKRKKVCYV